MAAIATASPPSQIQTTPLSSATGSSNPPHLHQPQPITPKKHMSRPSLHDRQNSASMIVPANHPEIEDQKPREFPPDDARAMSPRQSNENLEVMCDESRNKIQSSTIEHQSSLAALVEKIETVKSGHEKLERDNNALQEYIGGLTKSMSKTDLAKGGKKSSK